LAASLAAGIAWATTTAILWELAEYVTFVPDSPEAATAYADTLGDLALGLIGGTAASVLVAWWGTRRPRADAVDATPAEGEPVPVRGAVP
jgi:hypothetical protein